MLHQHRVYNFGIPLHKYISDEQIDNMYLCITMNKMSWDIFMPLPIIVISPWILYIPGFTFHRGGCFFALISIFTVFGRFFLHIHLLYMMERFNFQTIIELSEVTGCEVRK